MKNHALQLDNAIIIHSSMTVQQGAAFFRKEKFKVLPLIQIINL